MLRLEKTAGNRAVMLWVDACFRPCKCLSIQCHCGVGQLAFFF